MTTIGETMNEDTSQSVEHKAADVRPDHIKYILQDSDMSPVTQEFLKYSLTCFRSDWIELCRKYWALFEAVEKSPEEYLSNHMMFLLRGGIRDFGNFLCQFEGFFGEINERTVSLRFGLKNPREYFSKLRDHCRDDDGIRDIHSRVRIKQILHELHTLNEEFLAHQVKIK